MSGMYLGPAESIHDLQNRVATLFGESNPGAGIRYNRFQGGMTLTQGDLGHHCVLRGARYSNGLELFIPQHTGTGSWPSQGEYTVDDGFTNLGFDTLTIDREGDALSLQYGKREVRQGLRDTAAETRTERELETLLTYNLSHQLNVQLSKTETRRTYRRDDAEGKVTNKRSVVLNWYQGENSIPSVTAIIERADHVWEATYNQSGLLISMAKYAIDDSRTQIAVVNFNSQQELAEKSRTENHPNEEAQARTALWDNFKITPDIRIDPRASLDQITNDGKVVLKKRQVAYAGQL